jgi:hypothetical protein
VDQRMSDCVRQLRRGDGEQRLRRDIEVKDGRGGILACDSSMRVHVASSTYYRRLSESLVSR